MQSDAAQSDLAARPSQEPPPPQLPSAVLPLRAKGLPPTVPGETLSASAAGSKHQGSSTGAAPPDPDAHAASQAAQPHPGPSRRQLSAQTASASRAAPQQPATPQATPEHATDGVPAALPAAEAVAKGVTADGAKRAAGTALLSSSTPPHLQAGFDLMTEPQLAAAPASLFTAGVAGAPFPDQVAMVRQRAALEHERLSEGVLPGLMPRWLACCRRPGSQRAVGSRAGFAVRVLLSAFCCYGAWTL